MKTPDPPESLVIAKKTFRLGEVFLLESLITPCFYQILGMTSGIISTPHTFSPKNDC